MRKPDGYIRKNDNGHFVFSTFAHTEEGSDCVHTLTQCDEAKPVCLVSPKLLSLLEELVGACQPFKESESKYERDLMEQIEAELEKLLPEDKKNG